MQETIRAAKPLFTGPEWNFDLLRDTYDAIAEIGLGEMGLDIYRNQIEVITAEQMLDAYSSIGMPVMYRHWSFGKRFARDDVLYRKGYRSLAFEIVINSDPCINYIMEENSMTMQALVMAHAAMGHNHFFKNNYLFRQWTQADAILEYLAFAKRFVAECEERYGLSQVESVLDAAHALMNQGVSKNARPRRRHDAVRRTRTGNPAARICHRDPQRAVADTTQRQGERGRRRARRTRPSSRRCRCPRKTFCTSSKRTRPSWKAGSASCCASCACSRNISIRSARPRS